MLGQDVPSTPQTAIELKLHASQPCPSQCQVQTTQQKLQCFPFAYYQIPVRLLHMSLTVPPFIHALVSFTAGFPSVPFGSLRFPSVSFGSLRFPSVPVHSLQFPSVPFAPSRPAPASHTYVLPSQVFTSRIASTLIVCSAVLEHSGPNEFPKQIYMHSATWQCICLIYIFIVI